MHEDVLEVLYSESEIAQRVAQLGAEITRDYAGVPASEGITIVAVLRGAAIFMADLVRHIDLPLQIDFMAVSSYGMGAQSSGVVSILQDLKGDIKGRHVIIVEDIIDTGLTLAALVRQLREREPASLTIAACLRKQISDQADLDCRYVGFECPDEFIVGYGLDYAEHYRNLPYIGSLKPEIYA